jgi:hypothetical protein
MECLTCRKTLDESDGPRGSISILVMGDEYIYSYVFCCRCNTYTVESFHDHFLGEDSISYFSADRETGDRAIELIKACPDPDNKHCTCDSHKALYYGTP